MADGIKISIEQIAEVKASVAALPKILGDQLDKMLDKHAISMATKAKQRAPKNEGTLARETSADVKKYLEKYVTVNVPYAAFVEFGTGKFAAAYVSSLPADWQQYAAQFRGQKGGGSFDELVLRLKEWYRRHPEYLESQDQQYDAESGNVIHRKPGRRSRDDREAQLDRAAYFTARKKMIEGTRAQPNLYPSFKEVVEDLKKDLKTLKL